jgi:release factor glutamine methyltransferase
VLANDVSSDALDVARDNAQRLGLGNVEFVKSDWYERVALEWRGGAFDLIASNPPYVAAADPHLKEGDVRFEPERSLTPGGDGWGAIRKILGGARENGLCPVGRLPWSMVRSVGSGAGDVWGGGIARVWPRDDLAGLRGVRRGSGTVQRTHDTRPPRLSTCV